MNGDSLTNGSKRLQKLMQKEEFYLVTNIKLKRQGSF